MAISVLDIFKIGIGPSSSHTMGPMVAARRFAGEVVALPVERVVVELYGSLALTGKGHCTDRALILGLLGHEAAQIEPERMERDLAAVEGAGKVALMGQREVPFAAKRDLVWRRRQALPFHPNGLIFQALDGSGGLLLERTFYSVGGGYVVTAEDAQQNRLIPMPVALAHEFATGDELLERCRDTGLGIPELMLANEEAWRPVAETEEGLRAVAAAMAACIESGCRTPGVLPGALKVRRRAPDLANALAAAPEASLKDPLTALDWVNLYALAVNEENAAGRRVVTAPTNGAAGIIPAVIRYYQRFCPQTREQGVRDLLLTAGAIGILYARNASISGAEVGCQGEVGVACSMAAGGLVAAQGGTPQQSEMAAEIGMEHNLGLTCDPIGGLVQIPCIERNAMGAVKAINAARIALRASGPSRVSLDSVIRTMAATGKDMKTKYKETSRGGLAVNVTAC